MKNSLIKLFPETILALDIDINIFIYHPVIKPIKKDTTATIIMTFILKREGFSPNASS
jgi:hypothetical protein